MKYWYDTEFIDDGKTIDLISIGIVAEDGREYYAQSCEFSTNKASPWVMGHVIPCLHFCPRKGKEQHKGKCPENGCPWRSRAELRDEIKDFMTPAINSKPELWGYYSAYDHVAFCQIFGTMMDLPKGFPMYTRDIKQLLDELGGVHQLPEQGEDEHNALSDARWNKQAWEFLQEMERRQMERQQGGQP